MLASITKFAGYLRVKPRNLGLLGVKDPLHLPVPCASVSQATTAGSRNEQNLSVAGSNEKKL